ncbi:hypothetical protein SALBM311S_10537 [Streptomyces alboniger]
MAEPVVQGGYSSGIARPACEFGVLSACFDHQRCARSIPELQIKDVAVQVADTLGEASIAVTRIRRVCSSDLVVRGCNIQHTLRFAHSLGNRFCALRALRRVLGQQCLDDGVQLSGHAGTMGTRRCRRIVLMHPAHGHGVVIRGAEGWTPCQHLV